MIPNTLDSINATVAVTRAGKDMNFVATPFQGCGQFGYMRCYTSYRVGLECLPRKHCTFHTVLRLRQLPAREPFIDFWLLDRPQLWKIAQARQNSTDMSDVIQTTEIVGFPQQTFRIDTAFAIHQEMIMMEALR